jgi:hypothetical protein
MADYSVVLFHSTAHALRAEKVLERSGVRIKLIPTPRQLSSDCGVALRFERAEEERVAAALAESQVPTNGIHPLQPPSPCGGGPG